MLNPHLFEALETLYETYNRREFVHPDPLETLYEYSSTADREIAALLAAGLAYGRVAQILRSINRLFALLGASPSSGVFAPALKEREAQIRALRHRFTSGDELFDFLCGIGRVREKHGSLEALFVQGYSREGHVGGGLAALRDEIVGAGASSLFPDPRKNSACKRLHLFLRWMVRRDAVDPGGWQLSPSILIIPLDTHMHRIARGLGLTTRRDSSWRTAAEITSQFAHFAPTDPVRYDFCLTRLGINPEVSKMFERFMRHATPT